MEPIAIVGLAFRLPDGVEDDLSFWDMLENKRNVMKEWPENRANIETFYKPGSGIKNTASPTKICLQSLRSTDKEISYIQGVATL
jgi:acyl transferase domain-containing protein